MTIVEMARKLRPLCLRHPEMFDPEVRATIWLACHRPKELENDAERIPAVYKFFFPKD